jgi:membrane associated rhomboid family serine protease
LFPLKDNIPTARFPLITVALIVLNAFVYFVLQRGGILSAPGDRGVIDYGWIPYEISHSGQQCVAQGPNIACGDVSGQPSLLVTAFTSMFMHGSIVHLGGNMLFLWIFGNNVEDAMGRIKFIIFYLLGGLAALALQTAVDPGSAVPTIGASGAIAAVLGGYILLYPRARVLTAVIIIFFFTLIEIPAMWFLVIWFGEQLLLGALGLTTPGSSGGGVAYFAHIGGFAFGLLAIRAFAHRRNDTYAATTA